MGLFLDNLWFFSSTIDSLIHHWVYKVISMISINRSSLNYQLLDSLYVIEKSSIHIKELSGELMCTTLSFINNPFSSLFISLNMLNKNRDFIKSLVYILCHCHNLDIWVKFVKFRSILSTKYIFKGFSHYFILVVGYNRLLLSIKVRWDIKELVHLQIGNLRPLKQKLEILLRVKRIQVSNVRSASTNLFNRLTFIQPKFLSG